MPDVFQYSWIAWIVIALVCVVLELVSLQLLFIMIAAGAVIGGIGAELFGLPWEAQILLAAVVSVVLLFAIRPRLLHLVARGGDDRPMNIAALTGMTATATTTFSDGAGQAKLANGETWTARLTPAHEGDPVAPGSELVVLGVQGATALVTPAVPVDPDHPLWA